MDTDRLRQALAAALDAIDSPDPAPADDGPTYSEVVEAETEQAVELIEAEAEAEAKLIAARAEAEAEVIEAEAEAEAEVIEAEAEAATEVIEAEAEAEADDDDPDDDDDDDGGLFDCPDDIGEVLAELVDDAVELIEEPGEVLDAPEPDRAPAATHWYTRRRRFRG